MAAKQSRNANLPQEGADIVETGFAFGEYADVSAVIEEGPRYLAKRGASVERWLIDDVAPTYDRKKSNPERGVSPDDVRKRLDVRAAAGETSEP
jgi:antitoxin ParD1/3/4